MEESSQDKSAVSLKTMDIAVTAVFLVFGVVVFTLSILRFRKQLE